MVRDSRYVMTVETLQRDDATFRRDVRSLVRGIGPRIATDTSEGIRSALRLRYPEAEVRARVAWSPSGTPHLSWTEWRTEVDGFTPAARGSERLDIRCLACEHSLGLDDDVVYLADLPTAWSPELATPLIVHARCMVRVDPAFKRGPIQSLRALIVGLLRP